MAFENVNVTSLKNALNSCKNSINYSISENLLSSVINRDVWESESSKKLQKAISTLKNERYKELEKLIDKYLGAVNSIEDYKNLEEENKRLLQEYNRLSNNLYYTEYYDEESFDKDGNKTKIRKSRRVKSYTVERQMNNINIKISNNKDKMSNLNTKVKNIF